MDTKVLQIRSASSSAAAIRPASGALGLTSQYAATSAAGTFTITVR
jgi:hypothetical protein